MSPRVLGLASAGVGPRTEFRVEYVDARTVKMSSIQYRNLDL